ncbi:MAG: serine/threonine protein kinase [Myxococcaceae bacterium]|nr:serine/threonine protein kinase [Myxococcaceae bacterium]
MGHASAVASVPPHTVIIAGRYRVQRLLGQGGMGAVYAVVDLSNQRELALKRLASGASAATAALFEREYHTLAGLRHPCIVEVYEYGRHQGELFYTMELIDGVDLSKQAPMPWRDACRDLRDAASILGILHARQLLHRDLSPRNLLRSRSGRLKLIDFGALAKFGPSSELVGTPPFVAPEALRGAALDHRTDLFALGALAYWLVTGVHAYPARSLSDLPRLWESELAPPSELLRVLGSNTLEPIPAELDVLVATLLRREPSERLGSTGELIDQLNAIAGLEPEVQETAVQGYLNSKAFVGRTRERERALSLLAEASEGTVRTLLVEGDAGVGRSRFLQELVVVARLSGALPVLADQGLGARPYGVAERLLLQLLRTLPDQTREAVADHASLLSSLSKEVRAELRVTARPSMLHASAETRIRLLNALREVLLTLSRDRLLAIVVDDVQAIDEESQALLAALAHAEPGHRLLLVAALGREGKRDSAPALNSLRSQATRMRLLPLSQPEIHELLRSVFGPAPYLNRLSERLHRASDGSPAYCLELATHLVETGQAVYQEGAWSLPVELASDSLPASRQAAQVARLDRLTEPARALARNLSVPHDSVLSTDECLAVSDLEPTSVHELLAELTREGVLSATADGYRFAHADVKASLYAELDATGRARSHLRLGEQRVRAASGDVLDHVRACLHFLRAGDATRAFVQQQTMLAHYHHGDVSTLRQAAPLIEEIYELQRARGEDRYGTVGLLGLLGMAGYFADRRYAARYGELAIETLQEVLRLDLARRLTRWLGAKLSLLVALTIAGVSLALRKKRAPSLQRLIRQLMGAAASLAGTGAVCIDPDSVAHYAEAIRPFTVLGKDHAANITYISARAGLPHLRDHVAAGDRGVTELIARLESPRPIKDLPDGVKMNYLAGALFMHGVIKSWRDGPECLQIADKLEQFGPLYMMSADYLRSSFYAGQGDEKRAAHFRERMEVHAVQLGSAWQVETWAPADAIKNGLRLHDASVLKRGLQELARLSAEVPSLIEPERDARGAYLVMRRQYTQAIQVLERGEEPCQRAGWTRSRGMLAQAHNALGEHERAKEVCLHALSFHDSDDLDYVITLLNVQLELAVAEAGLGHVAVAKHQLDRVLARSQPHQSAVTLGAIHRVRAQVALGERNFADAREHWSKMDALYRSTGVSTLIALLEPLRREIDRAESPRATGPDNDVLLDRTQHVMLRVQLLMSEHSNTLISERAQKGLQVALELSSADEGFIVLANQQDGPVAHLGSDTPSTELVSWAEQNMLDAGVDEQTVMTEEVHSEIDSNYKVVGQMRYCVVPLWARKGREDCVVAALVLGFDNRVPKIPEPTVMRAIAQHLMGEEAVAPA